MNAYVSMIERYADEAAFLWVLRSLAVDQPHYNKNDLFNLEKRLNAQLDGLMTRPEDAWRICTTAMESGEAGETFTAAVLAFRSLDVEKIQYVIEVGAVREDLRVGLISAMGWLPGRICHSWIKRFLTSKDLDHKYLAIAACSVRREDPVVYLSEILRREDCRAHVDLYARSLRLVGELKRNDLVSALTVGMESEVPEIQFWANWSASLLGNRSNLRWYQPLVITPNPHQRRAIDLCFRVLPVDVARGWIGQMVQASSKLADTRLVIGAVAALGDPHAVNWLIAQMRNPALSRLAGEAFTAITGVQLMENGLALNELPNLDALLPNDDPADSKVGMDDDEHLPFPDTDKVAAVWQRYSTRFIVGRRYFYGKDVSEANLADLADKGNQRQRRAADLELSLLDHRRLLANHRMKTIAD